MGHPTLIGTLYGTAYEEGGVVSGGAAMESVRTPHFLSENLVVVVTEATVTVEGERQETTYADVLVRTAQGWAFQTMIQGGWGHGWAPACRG